MSRHFPVLALAAWLIGWGLPVHAGWISCGPAPAPAAGTVEEPGLMEMLIASLCDFGATVAPAVEDSAAPMEAPLAAIGTGLADAAAWIGGTMTALSAGLADAAKAMAAPLSDLGAAAFSAGCQAIGGCDWFATPPPAQPISPPANS